MKLDLKGFRAWLEKEQYSMTSVPGRVNDIARLERLSEEVTYPDNVAEYGAGPTRIQAYRYAWGLYAAFAEVTGKPKPDFEPPPHACRASRASTQAKPGRVSALEAEIFRLRSEKVTSPQVQWIAEEKNRRLFVHPCVSDDARDLLRFIADAFQARTIIVIDNILKLIFDNSFPHDSFPRWELMEELLRNAVTHNPDAAVEMLVNILTHVGILDHDGNWLGSTTHGAHDKYLDELLGEGAENGNI